MANSPRVKARMYLCGGGGTDLGLQVQSKTFTKSFIDASDSNLKTGMVREECYFIEGLNGSGKNRNENAKVIAPLIPTILEEHQAGDFNVVVYTAAGGSGSVIAPYLIKALLADKRPVISVVIGVVDTAQDIKNTLNTLKTLEAFSVATGQPAIVNYHENVVGQPQKLVDQDVLFCLEALGDLLSQNNDRLDLMDLTNFVQYHKVTPIHPQLAYLGVFDNRPAATQVVEPMLTVSLHTDPDKNVAIGQPYISYAGFPRDPENVVSDQLHFVINTADMDRITTDLTSSQTALNQKLGSYRQRRPIVSIDDNITEDGFIA